MAAEAKATKARATRGAGARVAPGARAASAANVANAASAASPSDAATAKHDYEKGRESMPAALLRALVTAYAGVVAGAALAGAGAGALMGWLVAAGWPGWVAVVVGLAVALLVASVVALVGVPAAVVRDIVGHAVPNGFGLCRGDGTGPEGVDRITPWLHKLIQEAADLPLGHPLVFGDLWHAPGFPPESMEPMDAHGRSIDLEMFTTNLAHGRPYVFPHQDEHARLFFHPRELEPYLPPDVMCWINQHCGQYVPGEGDPPVEELDRRGLKQIPSAEQFPVVLAARMSLSYPFLFSAVPLWAIDYERPPGRRDFRRCWFSDGGIASNFPMHLFDGFLPGWPTFGIDLESHLAGSRYVYLPQTPDQGVADRWDRFDDEKAPSTRFGGFFSAVLSTMQNWNDNTNARMPGVRDRIARVRLDEEEGGFNLDMPAALQKAVADRGSDAAQALIDRFVDSLGPAGGWDCQRWARLAVLIRTLQKRMPGVEVAMRRNLPHTTSYADLAHHAARQVPGGSDSLSPKKVADLNRLLALIEQTAKVLGPEAEAFDAKPIPDPELRVRPPL
jgi:hypothetical protein